MYLATIGFIVGAVLFAGYAYSIRSYTVSCGISRFYPWAYYTLALTFLLWGIATANGNQHFLNISILLGNALILIGSALLLEIVTHKKGIVLWGVVIAIVIFIARLMFFSPAPYMQGGILIFNTNIIVSLVYAMLFFCIWLPANLSVGKAIGSLGKSPEFTQLLRGLFGLSTIAAVFMPIARTPIMVVVAFVTLAVCYSVLIAVNVLLRDNK